MPPKPMRNSVVNIQPEELVLSCEWQDCSEVYSCLDEFTSHVTQHLTHFLTTQQEQTQDTDEHHCYWRDCNTDVEGETSAFLRHVYFHTFHAKIKCIGALLLEKTGRRVCSLDSQRRNIIPELPERLECGWTECRHMYDNAVLFYRHVENHADCFPDGNNVHGGCKCIWDGCDIVVKSKHKLKDHLRSHTQEKLVACPTCGALFSTRTKFFDHLSRQMATYTGKRYQCSHCNRTFAAERLLRDHMRNHVNQYKCPYCDMTSPSPSCLRLHIKYRHTDDKPYKCEICDHSCKGIWDLRKHIDTHNEDHIYQCQVAECTYSARGYQSLANHFKRIHQNLNISNYQCHVCEAKFTRGSVLTKHLKKQHKFNWPSGHSRFRYKLHSDGIWRLQTVRYESIHISSESETTTGQSGSSIINNQSDNSNGTDQSESMNENFDLLELSNEDLFENEVNNEMHVDSLSEDNTHSCTKIKKLSKNEKKAVARDKNVDETDTNTAKVLNSPTSPKRLRKRKRGIKDTNNTKKKNQYCKVLAETNNNECDNDADGEPAMVKISILTDKDGKYVIQSEDTETPLLLDMPDSEEFEENMYNLQMLGDVALQDQKRKKSKK